MQRSVRLALWSGAVLAAIACGANVALVSPPSEVHVRHVDSGGGARDTAPPVCALPAEAGARWIAFDSDRAVGNRDIYLTRADGSELVRLTTEPSDAQLRQPLRRIATRMRKNVRERGRGVSSSASGRAPMERA